MKKNSEKLSISLPAEMIKTIRHQIEIGRYSSISELLRDAMRLWEHEQAKSNKLGD